MSIYVLKLTHVHFGDVWKSTACVPCGWSTSSWFAIYFILLPSTQAVLIISGIPLSIERKMEHKNRPYCRCQQCLQNSISTQQQHHTSVFDIDECFDEKCEKCEASVKNEHVYYASWKIFYRASCFERSTVQTQQNYFVQKWKCCYHI